MAFATPALTGELTSDETCPDVSSEHTLISAAEPPEAEPPEDVAGAPADEETEAGVEVGSLAVVPEVAVVMPAEVLTEDPLLHAVMLRTVAPMAIAAANDTRRRDEARFMSPGPGCPGPVIGSDVSARRAGRRVGIGSIAVVSFESAVRWGRARSAPSRSAASPS